MQEHVQELERMQNLIDQLQGKLDEATEIAKLDLEQKYEQRLEFVRKMHQEELYETRRLAI